MMDQMIMVVFENETKAYEGSKALQDLMNEGTINLYAMAVIIRDTNEKVSVKQQGDMGPVATAVGMLTGSLVGILGGPLGVALGAGAGTLGGMMVDLAQLGVGQGFLAEIEQSLQPGKAAVVAEIEEEWTTPVDTRMEALGGVIMRRTRREVIDNQVKQDTEAIKADLAELEDAYHEATGQARAKLQKKVDAARNRMQAKLDDIQSKIEMSQLETEAKIKFLQEQAARENGKRKAATKARITELQAAQKRRSNELKQTLQLAKKALSK
jgi:uncharacterized membrane protein